MDNLTTPGAMVLVALLTLISNVIVSFVNGRRTKIKEIHEEQKKSSAFMMKMLFEIIDIMAGKKINGQVKELRKEAEKFNIDN